MSDPTQYDASPGPAPGRVGLAGLIEGAGPSLAGLLELALFLRIAAAVAVEWQVRRGGTPRVCLFPDAEYYWALATTILDGRTYEIVEWGDIPHFALRAPGYPLFLAACRAVLGSRPLGARLAQAVLGSLTVWLVYRLTREVTGESGTPAAARPFSIPLIAALLTAVHPYFVAISALLLSEAVFVPLMVAVLWGMAAAWNRLAAGGRPGLLLPLAVGAGGGAAILVRPSWALFVPFLLGGLPVALVLGPAERRARTARGMWFAGVVVLGLCAVMAPWWVRNARVLGRFVPTAVWMGASLYDGLNPAATGGSDMRFLADPEFWPLDELDQDRMLTRRALAFAREHPGRVLGLAAIKLGRFWCPWPAAAGPARWPLVLLGLLVEVPVLALVGLGLWQCRHDVRAWVLLAGPLLYFCAVHLVFASSMRYRIPGEVPAVGLAAAALAWIGSRPVGRAPRATPTRPTG
jgi:4-amino-4-deoxy-L-arabinose transferase-like glycosyltransferase